MKKYIISSAIILVAIVGIGGYAYKVHQDNTSLPSVSSMSNESSPKNYDQALQYLKDFLGAKANDYTYEYFQTNKNEDDGSTSYLINFTTKSSPHLQGTYVVNSKSSIYTAD